MASLLGPLLLVGLGNRDRLLPLLGYQQRLHFHSSTFAHLRIHSSWTARAANFDECQEEYGDTIDTDEEDEEDGLVFHERRRRKKAAKRKKNDDSSDSDHESHILALLATVQDSEKAELLYKLVFVGLGIKLNLPDCSFIPSVKNNQGEEQAQSTGRLSPINYITYLLSDSMIPEDKYLKLHNYITSHLEIPPSLIINPFFSGRRRPQKKKNALDNREEALSKEEEHQKEESKNNRVLVVRKPDFSEPFVLWKPKSGKRRKKSRSKRRKKKTH